MQGRSKMQTVIVVVLTDCLFFLQENSQKYSFFTPENKVYTAFLIESIQYNILIFDNTN